MWTPIEKTVTDYQTRDQAIRGSLDDMAAIVSSDRSLPFSRALITDLLRSNGASIGNRLDLATVARLIASWIRRDLIYIPDPGFELLQDLLTTCAVGGGDCDCLSIAWATLFEAAGGQACFIAGSTGVPGQIEHVLPGIFHAEEDRAEPMEITSATLDLGDTTPGFTPELVKVVPI